ncbi:hypothetical protein EH243_08215 [Amphritea opalescens]|uniref:Uncharacterized protein n=1 Tax=Amphritea opalescens TaxID=2490544 RepID=A0A430KRY2_9GAMM|nr:hypothetical protein [Amphritea opalescens]RTE66094.1 hypothetical protein EH243_08215 [Amphritea opalescens]
MIPSGIHRDIYTQAANLRAEVQAELVLSAFALFKTTLKTNTPIFGPLMLRANAKMNMASLNKPQLKQSAAA